MTRSLRFKLLRAFVMVALTGGILAALLARWLTVQEFSDLVYQQTLTNFSSTVTAYYETNGSWEDVMAYMGGRGPLLRSPQSGTTSPVPPRDVPNPPLPNVAYVFALVDENGRVLIPAGPYRVGDFVPDSALTAGEPLAIDGVFVGTVLATGEAPPLDVRETEYISRTDRALLYAALGSTAVALILGLVLSRTLTHPLRELTTAVQNIASGRLKQEVPVRSQDEIGELAAAFNQMSADLDEANALRRQLTADIAHDLRSPLTVIAGYVESMQDGVLAATPARLQTIHQEVAHLQHLVSDLQTLARADAGELTLNLQSIAPRDLRERVINTYQHQADQQQISLQLNAAETLPHVRVDEERMAQVLGNLVSNALRYTPAGGAITLAAAVSANQVQITVSDTGAGIDPAHISKIFHRFYRADESRQSESGESGLGLAIVKSTVEAHGGRITAVSAGVNQGTAFAIYLAEV